MKAIEELGFGGDSLRIYEPARVQKKMRKRFTTENPVSKRRMLAVRRSAQESSFSIKDSDSVFFHHSSFFEDTTDSTDSKKIKEWDNLVNAQLYHKRNQFEDWTSPIAYGVAMMMAKSGKRMNSRTASEMYNKSLHVILCSSLPNGLFAGLLDGKTKEPSFINSSLDQENYWWDSFEMPYLVWRAGVEPKLSQSRKREKTKSGPSQHDQMPDLDLPMDEYMSIKTLLGHQGLVDSKNISEYPDEWLIKSPDFLHFDPKQAPESNSSGHECDFLSSRPIVEKSDAVGLVAYDMGDSPTEQVKFVRNSDIVARMCQCRTAGKKALVKRRFIWIPWGNSDTRENCLSAASESQKAGLSAFFQRHMNHEKSFFDDPIPVDNTWITEFHLPFYQIHEETVEAEQRSPGQGKAAMGMERSFPLKGTLLERMSNQGTHSVIRRGAIGFRFYGDFFDRYWNCHFVEQNRKDADRKREGKDLTSPSGMLYWALGSSYQPGAKELQNEPWRQRKLLELILFDQMMIQIRHCTEEILAKIREALRNPEGTSSTTPTAPEDEMSDAIFLSRIDSKTYFFFSRQWQTLEKILQLLHDDLTETLLKVSSWESREKDRGSERPRWTGKDERMYRGSLRKMLVSNSQNVAQLRRVQANVQSLRASLSSKRESIRDDLSLRGSEDVRYFTYVTVVFLPLGFASSIFSTSGSPTNTTLGWMATTALATLCVTIIVLCAMSWYHNPERWQARWEGLKDFLKFQHKHQKMITGLFQTAAVQVDSNHAAMQESGQDARKTGQASKRPSAGAVRESRKSKDVDDAERGQAQVAAHSY